LRGVVAPRALQLQQDLAFAIAAEPFVCDRGVVMTIVMKPGLIDPPVGLNTFVIKNIAPYISLREIIWGVMPLVGLMIFGMVRVCAFPAIATLLPDLVMGAPK
jgi:C4-dicarboxylate transporter DctM subunit